MVPCRVSDSCLILFNHLLIDDFAVGYYGFFSEGSKKFIKACGKLGIHNPPDINTHKGTLGVSKVSASF